MNIRTLSKILIALMWLSTLVIALCWLLWKNAPFDPEPITVVLGLLSTAMTGLLSEFDSKLQEEQFSLPYALAYGYVNNFVEPLISQLLKDISIGSNPPRLFIYIPKKISELEPKNIERIIGLIRVKNFRDNVITLNLLEGRARDILTITRDGDNQSVYFDFPNTLLSLNSLIEYKMESRRNRFGDNIKEAMGEEYILQFTRVLKEQLRKKDLMSRVFFVGNDLRFEF